MPKLTAWLKNQSVQQPAPLFFLLAYAFAWLLWIIAGLVGSQDRTFFRHLCTFAAFAPAFSAVFLVLLQSASKGEPLPRMRWDLLLGAWLVTGILYFVALPYASATPMEASIPGWILRGVLWLGPAWIAAWALGDAQRMRRLLLPVPGASNHPGWYALALLGMPALAFLADVLGRAIGLSLGTVEVVGTWWQAVLTIALTFIYLLLFGGALSEEPGLRGFALPALQERFSPVLATLILGMLSALWYLPIYLNGFFASTPESLPADLLNRLLGTLLAAFLYTWVYNRTRGNVLVCVLMHAAYNTAAMFLPQSPVTLGILAALAILVSLDLAGWGKPVRSA